MATVLRTYFMMQFISIPTKLIQRFRHESEIDTHKKDRNYTQSALAFTIFYKVSACLLIKKNRAYCHVAVAQKYLITLEKFLKMYNYLSYKVIRRVYLSVCDKLKN